jgi:hypothetical protein
MWSCDGRRRSLAWRDVLNEWNEWGRAGCIHGAAEKCNNGQETIGGHILIRGQSERETACSTGLTASAILFCRSRVYFATLRPQKEVPWIMKMNIDISRLLPAAVYPTPQPHWSRLVSTSQKLTETVIFEA